MVEERFDEAVDLFHEAVAAGRAGGSNGAGSIGNLGYVALLRGDYQEARQLSEQAIQLFRDRGHQSGIAVGIATLADAALLLGRTDEACAHTKEALVLGGELGFKEVIASSLDTSAALLAEGEHTMLAARLIGAADALREEMNTSQTPAERGLHDRVRATLRSSLGDRTVENLCDQGRGLEVDEAIALALGALDSKG